MRKDDGDAEYRRLLEPLSQLGYVSQGSAVERAPGQAGSRYLWTRKVKAKTVTVALSKEQYLWLREAIGNQRKCEQIIAQLQRHSRKVLFGTVPGVSRRKPLSRKVLGLI